MSGHADTIRRVLQQLGLPRYGRFERPAAQEGLDALDALATEIQQQADRIAWLEGDVAGWRIKNQQLRDALAVAVDVAIWMSGSGSFGPGGEAVAGWQKQRVRLYEVMDVLDGTPSAAQTLEDGTPTERAEASSNG